MPKKLDQTYTIGEIKGLNIRERDVLLMMSEWNPQIDGRCNTITLSTALGLSQSTVWVILNGLRNRGFVTYVSKRMIGHKGLSRAFSYWLLNPSCKQIIDEYNQTLKSAV